MDPISRRNMLAASAAGGFLTAATVAGAQTRPVLQPQRPGRGGTDYGPRNLTLYSRAAFHRSRHFA
jgi:oxalate decarboxylase